MFTPPLRQRARAIRPAGAASVAGAAVWRRYPKRDSKGSIEWIHWADLDLAAAWAEQAIRDLDAFVVKYSGPTASAAQLEGGARAPLTADAFGVLRSLNNAFQALNVPPIVAPASDDLGMVDLIRSYVVLAKGRVEVRTQLMLSASQRGPTPAEAMAALSRALGARELANDDGLVVDVRTRRTPFRGPFEAALAFKRNAANTDRAFLALWARRPWTIVRAEDETELVWSAPLVWERDRVVRKLELARTVAQAIATDPWSALASARGAIKANNDALADEWAGQMPNLSSERSTRQVESIRGSLDALAQARSAAALEQARAAAREGLATGAGSIAGVLGLVSAAAPPAALVLAPAAAVLGALAALAGLLLQVMPREWLATAESVPPRLPLPYMVTGDEGPASAPTHSVNAATRLAASTIAARTAPEPLDALPLTAVMTLDATVAPSRTSTIVRTTARPGNTAVKALLESPAPVPVAGSDDPRRDNRTEVLPLAPDRGRASPTPSRASSSSSTGVVLASIGIGAALWWLTARR